MASNSQIQAENLVHQQEFKNFHKAVYNKMLKD